MVGGYKIHNQIGYGELMKELGVFIDESGDFGEITERPAYYLVTLLYMTRGMKLLQM